MSEQLIVEEGTISRLTLNRPERHNALSTSLGDEVMSALTRLGRRPDVKVIILRGAGPSFCSGDDLKEGEGGRIPDFPWVNPYHCEHIELFGVQRHPYFQLVSLIRRIPQAVIAQVHGYCMGSAVDLMLAADFAIADPETKIRVVINATVLLPRYVGLKRAMKLIFDDKFISAQEAYQMGLVTAVASPGKLEEEVEELASRLAQIGTQRYGYIGLVKESVNRALFPTLEDDVRMQLLAIRLSDFYRGSHPPEERARS
jgi:enoyl-CoA hydratase